MPAPLSLIVACSTNRVIGRAGRLPFDLAEDKAWFHEQTSGATVVLGRIGFETWPRVLADGRRPVVITSQPERIQARARKIAPDILALARTLPGAIMICGGQRIFEETLPQADRLLLTLVHAEIPGDTWFPEWRQYPWREISRRESRDAQYRYTFFVLEK